MGNVTIATNTLTEHSDSTDSRTWSLGGHAATKPQVVIQKRRTPQSGNDTDILQDTLKVVYGTVDAASLPLQPKVSFEVIVRRPMGAASADINAARGVFQDLVASTEFTSLVDGQKYLG